MYLRPLNQSTLNNQKPQETQQDLGRNRDGVPVESRPTCGIQECIYGERTFGRTTE
jgi:hypothetical protein